jgi:hypothetical protein
MISPIRYIGDEVANIDYHHGLLRSVVGASHYQVLRANRSRPEMAEDCGWTYNHAPMLAYWRGKFYLEYLSNPVGEHIPPGHTLLTRSTDGVHWDKPEVIFPVNLIPNGVYQPAPGALASDAPMLPPDMPAVMHQRMGFYVAPDGRLLTLGFYGVGMSTQLTPNDGRGIGRVVREVYADGTYGPIYFIRYNRHAGWNESNTFYPFYTTSPDAGFVAACDALLANKLMTLQWWEEDRSSDGFYAVEGYKALSFYHLPDGRVAGVWKWSKAAISEDEGNTWSEMLDAPSLIMAGAKVWGQRTPDGRYALVYNPTQQDMYRWPLALVTSGDGLNYDNLLLVNGRVSTRRYAGQYKDFGISYVRGIAEGNGTPPGDAFWVTYSMNKEDIWVSRIPVPMRDAVAAPVDDDFSSIPLGGVVRDWNIHSGIWTRVEVCDAPDDTRSLRLSDRDPYENAQAERIFPVSRMVTVHLRLYAAQTEHGELHIELTNPRGLACVQIIFNADSQVWAQMASYRRAITTYQPNTWCDITLNADAVRQRYNMSINGKTLVTEAAFCRPTQSLQRVTLRTGPANTHPTLHTDRHMQGDLPDADETQQEAIYYISHLRTEHAHMHDPHSV